MSELEQSSQLRYQELVPGDMVSFMPNKAVGSFLDTKWNGAFIFIRRYRDDYFEWYEFMGSTGQPQSIGPYADIVALQRIGVCQG